MNELHSHGTFAHAGGHTLHRTMPHIPNGKNSRHIGFKQEWIAVERPSLGMFAASHQIRSRKDETAVVALDQARQPLGARHRPMKMNIELAETRSTLSVSEQSTEISSSLLSPWTSA